MLQVKLSISYVELTDSWKLYPKKKKRFTCISSVFCDATEIALNPITQSAIKEIKIVMIIIYWYSLLHKSIGEL